MVPLEAVAAVAPVLAAYRTVEAFRITEDITGRPQVHSYVAENRIGDHVVYYSDLRKMKAHYPGWDITVGLQDTIAQIAAAWRARLSP